MPFVGQRAVSIFVDTCGTCGESGDFISRNTSIVNDAIHSAEQEFIAKTVDWLAERGITMAYLERALSLPARTVTRWRDGEFSAAPIALLRFVRTYPWLLAVAEGAFDHGVAAKAVISSAADVIGAAQSPSVSPTSSPIMNVNVNFEIHNQNQLSAPMAEVAVPPAKGHFIQ